ncbi:hypothetical protein [Thalassotalea sp. PS06]|uniref:hypothetical protein n=1 Tax=Thalassotalea sp. PS06 TaxID=2594005 RepID=UPI001163517E|nr:hypothetical protein [Thalassotalea sp. PS06]QDP02188.1 hypothetical protein FNC98_13065 [Thalassotalea sp. PS06]
MAFVNKLDNVFGGEDIFLDGIFKGSTQPNILGGNNVFDATGSMAGSTRENILGGEDMLSSSGEHLGHTQAFGDNIAIFDGTGSYDGFVSQFGDMTTAFDASGGIEAINMGGTILGDIDLDPDALVETITNFV